MVDCLVIGHVTKDLTSAGPQLGGPVTYCALMSYALGYNIHVVTSTSENMRPSLGPLSACNLEIVPSHSATTFENNYLDAGRIQTLSAHAEPLLARHVPQSWLSIPIVQLTPVADEVDFDIIEHLSDAFLYVAPQGWMRAWDGDGLVTYKRWQHAEFLLAQADVVTMGMEDVQGDHNLILEYAALTKVLAVTDGANGSTIYIEGDPFEIASPEIEQSDPTGAGDIFGASFALRLYETGDPVQAAYFATLLASDSVTRTGVDGIPSQETIDFGRSETGG